MEAPKLRLKQLLKERGMTQADLARKLGILPVSFSQAVQRNNFDMKRLQKIADVLKVSIPELFGTGVITCPHCGKEITLKATPADND